MLVMEVDPGSEIREPEVPASSPVPGRAVAHPRPNPTDAPRQTPHQAPHKRRHDWRPLAGAALLERLRTTGRPRPEPDPQLVVTLRRGLEQGLIDHEPGDARTDSRPQVDRAGGVDPSPSPPLVVTKDRLNRVLACEAHLAAAEFGERTFTTALACGAIIDVLFRQLVTIGRIDDPVADGLSALSVDDRQRDLVSWIGRLPHTTQDELFSEVVRQAGGLVRRWPTLDPGWMPRTQEALRVRLAGGAIELSARVDLAVGRPVEDLASVAIVEVKSGTRRVEHRADLHFYTLIESLRNPAPPFVVATYYTRTGELDVDPVSGELLVAAARRTLAGIRSLRELAAGAEPRRTPNGLCGWCAALPECDPGRRHTAVSLRRPVEDQVPR